MEDNCFVLCHLASESLVEGGWLLAVLMALNWISNAWIRENVAGLCLTRSVSPGQSLIAGELCQSV